MTDSSGMHKRVWIWLAGFAVTSHCVVSCGEPAFDELNRPPPALEAGGAVAVPSGIRAKGGDAGTKSTGGRAATASTARGGTPATPAAAAGETGDGGDASSETPTEPTPSGSGGRTGAATGGRAATTGGTTASGGAVAMNGGGSPPLGGAAEIGAGSGAGGDASGGVSASGGSAPLPETGGTSTGGQGTGGTEPAPPSRALWFTEYFEGSEGNRKALEISTLAETTLRGCEVVIYSNGSTSKPRTIALEASLLPQSPWVLCSPELVNLPVGACSQSASLNFNGDDAVLLVCDEQLIDAIGTLGLAPEAKYWGTPELKTSDMTLRRACRVTQGDAIAEDAFEPSLEWESAGPDALDGLGSHCLE